MQETAMSQEVQQCIEECLLCYQSCMQEAMNHCLEKGGEHVEPRHFRLMMNCAEMCRTAAHFMLSSSELHARICGVCAEVCEACAQSCAQVGDMEECIVACRRCAESCRHMSGMAASTQDLYGSTRVKAPM